MKLVQGLAIAAAIMGAAAAFAGSPFQSPHIAAQQEHSVAPLELAAWIRARKPGLRIIDVRSPEAFAAYPIPTAENIQPSALTGAVFTDSQTIVLYAQDDAASARAMKAFMATSRSSVVFLSGGLMGWDANVMNATLPANASPQAAAAFEAIADLSRYFGGQPRNGPAVSAASPSSRSPAILRRRGC